MQRFSLSVVFCLMVVNTANSAYLPVVDVSRGDVSARAAFGEEFIGAKTVDVSPRVKTPERKVVARSAKKVSKNTSDLIAGDVLNPKRPSSDLWARQSETPLRMPRMDEIAVLDSDYVLPEESLDFQSAMFAQNENVVPRADDNKMADELKQLRAEVSRLSALQQETESKIAMARPVMVRTPISGESNVAPAPERTNVNVRREIVPSATEKNVVARSASDKLSEPVFSSVKDMTKMLPGELKKAFKKTYLSQNKHLSTYVDDKYDTVSDMTSNIEGFSAARDLSEMDSGIRPMEIKISFLNGDSGLSRENYNLLSETASIVVNNPKRAVQIAIPESVTHNKDARKLAARRLAIVEQVLRDTGIAERRIVPVLSQRDDDVFVLRIISGDTFESLTQQKKNMFGDDVSKKTYKSMSW